MSSGWIPTLSYICLTPFVSSLLLFLLHPYLLDKYRPDNGAYPMVCLFYEILCVVSVLIVMVMLSRYSYTMGQKHENWVLVLLGAMLIPFYGQLSYLNPFVWYTFVASVETITTYHRMSFLPIREILLYQKYLTAPLCLFLFAYGAKQAGGEAPHDE